MAQYEYCHLVNKTLYTRRSIIEMQEMCASESTAPFLHPQVWKRELDGPMSHNSLLMYYYFGFCLAEYMGPLLHELRDLNEIHVKSQWLHLVSLQVTPKLVEGDVRHFALPEASLPHVITPLEKKLGKRESCSISPSYGKFIWFNFHYFLKKLPLLSHLLVNHWPIYDPRRCREI